MNIMSDTKYVRNPQGIWINSQLFREEALSFRKNGYYCPEPWNSPAWKEYWTEQLNRCKYGYSVGGVRITGHHYFYLNFTEILLVEVGKNKKATKKTAASPAFWDGDYNYFWALEIARNGLSSMEEFEELNLDFKILPEYLDGGYHLIVGKARRKGYQQPYSETIITPNGKTTMGNIKVGDYVNTPSGKAKVLEKYEQGECDVYEITLQDGRKVRCGKEHLWNIIEFRGSRKTVDTEFFLNKKLKRGTKGKEYYSYYLPQTDEVKFDKKEDIPINPYLLGLLIGDGSVNRSTCLFSTVDKELLMSIKDIIGDDYSITKTNNTGFQYRISYLKESNKNPILSELKNLNLRTTALHKFIPDIYKYSSIEDRYELVRGLMDTDGSITKDGSCNFVNTSEQLIDDLAFVLRSLGIRCKKSKLNNLDKGFSKNQAWQLIITTDKQIFKLKRKADLIRKRNYNLNKIAIVNVKKLDYKEQSACILIDSNDHLYLTTDFVVTHNSYKNAAICANIYNTQPNSLTIIGAFEKKYLYPEGTMGMTTKYLDFLNKHTGWRKAREYVNTQEHKRASYREIANGVPIEQGYMSQVMALTFKDNPDAARGKDSQLILFEEAGKFPNLKDSYQATKEGLEAGISTTGQMVIFGTGGDMESGTKDFADMFYNPKENKLLPIINTWDENAQHSLCGYFHPMYLNMDGFYDVQGNSDIEKAKEYEENSRRRLRSDASSTYVLQKRVQEQPLCPAEAFLTVSTNDFPVIELRQQLEAIRKDKLHLKKGQAGKLYKDENGEIKFEMDLEGKLQPLWDYKIKESDISGCVVIFEYPVPNAPKGLYKIGHDPYRQEHSATSLSLGATYVYKGFMQGQFTYDNIVAVYVGRPKTSDSYNRNLEMLAELYNAEIGFENEVTAVKTYFENRKKLRLLAAQPDDVINANIKQSNVARVYGVHMPEKLKDAGEKYIKRWLLTERNIDENGKKILNLNTIYDPALIEELILYDRKGNYDRVMAFMILMMYIENDNPEFKENNEKRINKILNGLNIKLFQR